jgi:hypothetical protein
MVTQPSTKVCEACGKTFSKTQTMTRWTERRFCDRKCRGAAVRIHPPTTICQSCGREFPTPSGRRPRLQYCSLACSGKGRKGFRGKDVDDYGRYLARMLYPERRSCEVCGVDYFEGYVGRHHVNSDRLDNRPENIRYLCRLHHNAAHRISDGMLGGGPRPRVAARQRQAAIERAQMARELLADGLTHADVGRRMGFDPASVYRWLRKYPAS